MNKSDFKIGMFVSWKGTKANDNMKYKVVFIHDNYIIGDNYRNNSFTGHPSIWMKSDWNDLIEVKQIGWVHKNYIIPDDTVTNVTRDNPNYVKVSY